MAPEDFLATVTHTILDGQQRYIALCAAAPQQMPAKEELLQIVNGTVESIVRAAGDVPAAERARGAHQGSSIVVNLSFARIGSVLESQFDVPNVDDALRRIERESCRINEAPRANPRALGGGHYARSNVLREHYHANLRKREIYRPDPPKAAAVD